MNDTKLLKRIFVLVCVGTISSLIAIAVLTFGQIYSIKRCNIIEMQKQYTIQEIKEMCK